tara:strand:+ start:1350 stop:3368 length:2019 start_codon:yes stop_codon:yes gene_type:complete
LKINYRPEIDGLRAIAVFTVIFYHLEKILSKTNYISGGYLGVDVFFVISGYLIGSIIIKEIKLTKKFSFKNFYERRARRILPALFFVMVASSIVGIMFYLPSDLILFSKSILSSIFFISNVFFWRSSIIYNAEDSAYIPFLHTWSLSVEEQYYIIFPLIIIFFYKFYRNFLLTSLIILSILSLFLSSWASVNYPGANFYLLITRFWEILIGSVIAYYEILKKNEFNKLPKNNFFLLLSFLLFFIPFFYFDDHYYHPSIISIIPIIGVAGMIIYSTNQKKNLLVKILSSKIFVGIGLISYSLYLWHYPVFVFFKTFALTNSFNLFDFFLLILLIIILSIISFLFIEKPFRSKKFNTKSLLGILIFFSSVLIIFHIMVLTNNGYPNRISEKIQIVSKENFDNKKCETFFSDKKLFCIYTKSKYPEKKIILMGDSILNSISEDLISKLNLEKTELINMAKGGAFYTPLGNFINNKNAKYRNDMEIDLIREKVINDDVFKGRKVFIIFANYLEYLEQEKFIYVTKSQNVKNYDLINKNYSSDLRVKGKTNFKKNLKKNILDISRDNKVILLYPTPTAEEDVLREVNNLLNWNEKRNIEVDLDLFMERNKEIFELFDKINNKNIIKIYPHKFLCDKSTKKCELFDGENLIFYDKIHFTKYGSNTINSKIINIIEDIK